ncbi:MAG: hypothetical protein N3G75_01590 [Methanothrix sp.]|nr:hypothetical protein [Methanothrix sp.]MCX8206512.1 hypothetical protein [Methanothrix sp.]
MEYVIRINDSAGEGDPEPIFLRLPPGGSDEVRLRVVNLGEPTNLAVKTDQSISRHVKPEKMNHYIVLEETIPISVRMPETAEAVSGDLLLITDITTKKIPVTLEAEGMYRDDSEDLDADLGENENLDDYSDGYDSEGGQPRSSSGNPRDGYGDEEDDEDDRGDAGYYKSDRYRHGSWTEAREGESIDRYEPRPFYDMYTTNLIPFALILATTIVLMVLTFHTRTLPLFHGALATSMMIVSLIIYGTATLLRS